MLRNSFHLTAIIMKLHTKTPHRLRMCSIVSGSKGQRSRSQCIDYWKWFMLNNCFSFTPIIMKLHIKTPHEWRMCSSDFGVKRSKVKVTMHWFLKMFFFCIMYFPLQLSVSSWNFTQDSPWVEDESYLLLGQQVKGQGHNALIPEIIFCA